MIFLDAFLISFELVAAVDLLTLFLCPHQPVLTPFLFLRAVFSTHGSIDARHCRTTPIGHFFTARQATLFGRHRKAQTEKQSKM